MKYGSELSEIRTLFLVLIKDSMKRLSFALLLSLLSSILLAQEIELSDSELNNKLDSILYEGNLLYKYEKSAWIACDLAVENPDVKNEFYNYLSYEDQGEIKTIILGKGLQTCIAEYAFENSFDIPKSVKIEKRELSDKERTLIEVRQKILGNIKENNYEITAPEGYTLNLILLPFADKYKLYFIPGANQENIIPFGNDYIFIADKNGIIESWHKFHSRLIAMETEDVAELTHSHLRTTPLITATDICTFKLYAPFYEIDVFSVYSSAIGKYMKYSLKENCITVEKSGN